MQFIAIKGLCDAEQLILHDVEQLISKPGAPLLSILHLDNRLISNQIVDSRVNDAGTRFAAVS